MSPIDRAARSVNRIRIEAHGWFVAGCVAACSLGCSVYDSSLLQQGASLNNGGEGGMVGVFDAGGSGSTADQLPSAGAPEAGTAGGGGAASAGGSDSSDAGDSTGDAAGAWGGADASGGVGANGGAHAGGVGGAAGGASSGGSAGAAPVELAVGKMAIASGQQVGREASKGNDNDTSTRWCAPDGTYPQWWRVDLGAVHTLSQVSIRFEHSDRTYAYIVETSSNDAVYTQQRTASGTGVVQTLDFPPAVSARYVRVTVTSGLPTQVDGVGTWASFYEISLKGF